VAGHARVEMAALRAALEAVGCRNVQTYIQSGNVIFDSGDDPIRLFPRVHRAVCRLVDGNACVVFRTAAQLQALVAAAPFAAYASEAGLKLYAVCLADQPQRMPRFPWNDPRERLDAIGRKGLDVFVVSRRKPSGFYGFPNAFVEENVGVQATSRNWNTVMKIAAVLDTTKGRSKGPALRT